MTMGGDVEEGGEARAVDESVRHVRLPPPPTEECSRFYMSHARLVVKTSSHRSPVVSDVSTGFVRAPVVRSHVVLQRFWSRRSRGSEPCGRSIPDFLFGCE